MSTSHTAKVPWRWIELLMKKTIELPVNQSDLRKFGFVMAGFFALVVGLLLPWWWSLKWAYWPWAVASVFLLLAIAWPTALTGIYKYWMRFGRILEWINTRIILGVVFFLIFTPLGLIMRMIGKDTLDKRWDGRLATYRINTATRKADHMERQF